MFHVGTRSKWQLMQQQYLAARSLMKPVHQLAADSTQEDSWKKQ